MTTVTTLVQSLGSADPRQVLHSLELLSDSGEGRWYRRFCSTTKARKCVVKTLEVLAEEGREDAAQLVEQAMTDVDAAVRTGAMRTLAVLRGERAAKLALDHLEDEDTQVRATAVASLLASQNGERARAEVVLAQLVSDGDPEIRAEAAEALGQVPDPIASDVIVSLLYDSDREVVRAAIGAVQHRFERCGPNPLYATILDLPDGQSTPQTRCAGGAGRRGREHDRAFAALHALAGRADLGPPGGAQDHCAHRGAERCRRPR